MEGRILSAASVQSFRVSGFQSFRGFKSFFDSDRLGKILLQERWLFIEISGPSGQFRMAWLNLGKPCTQTRDLH